MGKLALINRIDDCLAKMNTPQQNQKTRYENSLLINTPGFTATVFSARDFTNKRNL